MKKLASLIMAILIAIMPMNLSFANEDNAHLVYLLNQLY